MQVVEAREKSASLLGSLYTSRRRGDAAEIQETAQKLLALGDTGLASLRVHLRACPADKQFLRVTAAMGERAAPLVSQLVKNYQAHAREDLALSRTFCDVFVRIGPAAAQAIPALVAALDNDCNLGEDAARALAGIGVAALPALEQVLRTGALAARTNALHALMQKGTSAESLLPTLEALKDRPEFKLTRIELTITAVREWGPVPPDGLCVPLV